MKLKKYMKPVAVTGVTLSLAGLLAKESVPHWEAGIKEHSTAAYMEGEAQAKGESTYSEWIENHREEGDKQERIALAEDGGTAASVALGAAYLYRKKRRSLAERIKKEQSFQEKIRTFFGGSDGPPDRN